MSDEQQHAVSEDVARAVLARAIELDARAPLTTIDELRGIAAELGVSSTALEVALREHAAPAPVAGPHRGVRASTVVAGVGLPLGAAAGVIVMTMPVFSMALPLAGVVGAGLIASAGVLLLQGRRASLLSFNARNTALWGGVLAGSLAAIAVVGGGSVAELPWLLTVNAAVRGWVYTTVFGSAAVVAIRRAVGSTRGDVDATPTARQGAWSALRERAAGMLDRLTGLRFAVPATREGPASNG